MAKKVIVLALRLALAVVFIQAGVVKIWDFAHARSATPDFAIAIQQYEILPSPDLAVLLAVYLPWLEILAAAALFLPRVRLGGLTALVGMTLVFLAALISAWARGLHIACGCFGKDEVSPDFTTPILRDLGILAAIGVLLFAEWHSRRRIARNPNEPA